ncbi:Fur-regulated basic protein FbpA [Peribacillus huizhouensis]|uniref:Fur-regulated basic protein FbpA n=1 Tax=Peribacillus huizhouensis TaxID=1501239 RepID=A0ABR6CNA8_9BACI|nr:Fur-regulated basic protein FbpA [Peribacillus huizhouensis]MBA9026409.1 hypothetical protein [Peribacillus huizhouensis]
MGDILRRAVEEKRQRLIDQLVAFKVIKEDDKHLFELSLTELENEFRKFQLDSHPHGEYSSIKWIHKNSKC